MSDVRADRIADRLRYEVAEHSEVTDPDDDFGWGYIAGLKRAIRLLTVEQEVDR